MNETQEIALDQARRLLGRLAFEVNRVLKSAEAERVHDLRVAIRRFSQLLAVFKSSFAGRDLRKIRRRLKKFLVAAGEVRNCDIAWKLISRSPAGHSELLRSKLKIRRKDCEQKLLSALTPWTERKTSLKWRSAVESALTTGQPALDARRIGEMQRETLSRMAKNFFAEGHKAVGAKGPQELHEFRISAKKFRYTLELFTPFYGKSFGGLVESLKLNQTLLGDINDCETTREMVANYEDVETLDAWLTKRQQKRIAEFRRQWAAQFGDRRTERDWIERLNQLPLPSPAERKPVEHSEPPSRSKLRRAAVA